MAGALTVRRAGVVFSAKGQFRAARMNGIGVVAPVSGNCVFTPLRRGLVSVTGSLTGV
jgi:hypothetical protein